MNCTVIQRRLLSAEQPEQPPTDIRSHLAQCPSCRAWQRRLIQMERLIPQLPVPPSTAREQFVQRMTEEGGRMNKAILIQTPPSSFRLPPFKKERGLRKLSLAFAMAASLLVFALAWWSWPHDRVAPPDLLQVEQARLDQRLSSSLRPDTPKERFLRLAKLAEEVHNERVRWSITVIGWSSGPFYKRVVGQHLIEQAQQLPPGERPIVLREVAERLRTMESEASRFARLQRASPRSAKAFEQIALVSKDGERDSRL